MTAAQSLIKMITQICSRTSLRQALRYRPHAILTHPKRSGGRYWQQHFSIAYLTAGCLESYQSIMHDFCAQQPQSVIPYTINTDSFHTGLGTMLTCCTLYCTALACAVPVQDGIAKYCDLNARLELKKRDTDAKMRAGRAEAVQFARPSKVCVVVARSGLLCTGLSYIRYIHQVLCVTHAPAAGTRRGGVLLLLL